MLPYSTGGIRKHHTTCLEECHVLKASCHVLRKSLDVHYISVLIYQMGLEHELNFPRSPLNSINIQMYEQIESSSYTLSIACFCFPAPEQRRAAVKLQQAAEIRFLASDLEGMQSH